MKKVLIASLVFLVGLSLAIGAYAGCGSCGSFVPSGAAAKGSAATKASTSKATKGTATTTSPAKGTAATTEKASK